MSDPGEEEDLLPDAVGSTNARPPEEGGVFFEFREVCKAFDDRVILNGVSFTVKKGQTCVIMGRSGVGKSVSLKHIMGFLKPDSGRILIDGQDVTDFSEREFEVVQLLLAVAIGPPHPWICNRQLSKFCGG